MFLRTVPGLFDRDCATLLVLLVCLCNSIKERFSSARRFFKRKADAKVTLSFHSRKLLSLFFPFLQVFSNKELFFAF